MKNYDWFYEQIKDATLEVVEKGEKVQWYRLRKKPDSTIMSTDLVFLPNAVVITGDLRVCQNGCQALGYGLDWFSRRLEPSYLAEKFLERRWVPESAQTYFSEMLAHYKACLTDWKAEVDKMRAEEGDDFEEPEPDDKYLKKTTWAVCGETLEEVTIVEALECLLDDENSDYFSSPDNLSSGLPAYQLPKSHPWASSYRATYQCAFEGADGYGGYDYPEGEVGWLSAINRRFSELYSQPGLIDKRPEPIEHPEKI